MIIVQRFLFVCWTFQSKRMSWIFKKSLSSQQNCLFRCNDAHKYVKNWKVKSCFFGYLAIHISIPKTSRKCVNHPLRCQNKRKRFILLLTTSITWNIEIKLCDFWYLEKLDLDRVVFSFKKKTPKILNSQLNISIYKILYYSDTFQITYLYILHFI